MDLSPKKPDPAWVTDDLATRISSDRRCFGYYSGDLGQEDCKACPVAERCREQRNTVTLNLIRKNPQAASVSPTDALLDLQAAPRSDSPFTKFSKKTG